MTTSYGAPATPVATITPAQRRHDTMHTPRSERAALLWKLADHHLQHPDLAATTVGISSTRPSLQVVTGLDALIDWFVSLDVEFATVSRQFDASGWCHVGADAEIDGHPVNVWGAAHDLDHTGLHNNSILPVRFLVCARDVVRTGWAEAVASLDAPRVTA